MSTPTKSEQVADASINLITVLFVLGVLIIIGIAAFWFLSNNGFF